MFKFRNLSIKQKLSIIILMTCSLVILLIAAMAFYLEWHSFRQGILHNASTLAVVIGSNSTAALTFQDPNTANEILAALKAEPNVLAARIYTKDGELFASYNTPHTQQSASSNSGGPTTLQNEDISYIFRENEKGFQFTDGRLNVVKPIIMKNRVIGTIFVCLSLEKLNIRLKMFAAAMFGSTLICFLLAFIAAARLQRIISKPILNLVQKMDVVSKEKNYTIRALKNSNDETGDLVDGFNDMIEQIQIRDLELKKHRTELEKLVSIRTEELNISEKQKKRLLFQQTIQEAYGKIITLLNSIDISEILGNSLREIILQTNSRWGAFYLCNGDRKTPAIKKSLWKNEHPTGPMAIQEWQDRAQHLAEQTVESQQIEVIPISGLKDSDNDSNVNLSAFPIAFQNQSLGALVLDAKDPFSTWISNFLKNTTQQLGVSLSNAQTFDNFRQKSSELEHRNQELKMVSEAKSDFLANMSHELRTPLNHIIGFTSLVVDKNFGELNDLQEEYLNDVLSSSNHLLSLINDILDLSKVESGKMILDQSPVDIHNLLSSSMTMIKEKAIKHDIHLSFNPSNIPEIIEVDERKIKQVVYNLLSNAVKFTPNGGKIDMRADVSDWPGLEKNVPELFREELYSIVDRNCPSYLRISVSDTGIGIKQESLKSVFDAFQQEEKSTSRKYGGTGLGLSLCKQLTELHKGIIWAESALGKGSSFRVVLPIDKTTELETNALPNIGDNTAL